MAIWNVRYYIDPETGLPHIYNHDVSEEEVEEVLTRPGEDRRGYEGARVAIGQTRAGRLCLAPKTGPRAKVKDLIYNV